MMVTLLATTPCVLCGFRFRLLMVATVRVNRRSMRTTAPMIGATTEYRCPECGLPRQGEMAPRSPYVLDPESAARVREYREKRWPELVGA